MNFGAFKRACDFINSIYFKADGEGKLHKKESMGIKGWICWGFRILGLVGMVLSIGLLTTPFLLAFTWVEALVLCAVGILLSRQFFNFYLWWDACEATVLMLWMRWKKMDIKEYANKYAEAEA